MTQRSDIERTLAAWFEDGPWSMPDHVVENVARRISVQPQRHPWRLHWRQPSMRGLTLTGAFAAVIVAAVGYGIFNGGRPVAGTPITSPSQALSTPPTTAPAATESASRWLPVNGQPLDEGSYFVQILGGPRVTFDAPAGWLGWGGGMSSSSDHGISASMGPGTLIVFGTAEGLFSDFCHWDATGKGVWPQPGDIKVGPTASDLVAALAAHPGLRTSGRSAVTIGGYAGERIDVELRERIDAAACDRIRSDTSGSYWIWGTADMSGSNFAPEPGMVLHLSMLDVGRTRLVIVLGDFADTSQSDRDLATSVLRSISITP